MSLNLTNIGWCVHTHNAVSGCTPISPECAECYAEALSEMRRGTRAFPNGFDITWRNNLRELLNIPGGDLVFEGSMTDWFQEDIPDERIDELLDTIEALGRRNPAAQIIMLTKRSGRLVRYSRRRPIPGNVWIGVTYGFHNPKAYWHAPLGKCGQRFDVTVDPTDDNRHAWDRIRQLHEVQGGRFKFVSCEPMLTRMSGIREVLKGIDWLIAGGVSGVKMWNPSYRRAKGLVEYVGGVWRIREDRLPWLLELQEDCAAAGTTFFYKQGGGPQPESAGHLLLGKSYAAWPDGKDWAAVKAPLLEAKAAAKARSKDRKRAAAEAGQLALEV